MFFSHLFAQKEEKKAGRSFLSLKLLTFDSKCVFYNVFVQAFFNVSTFQVKTFEVKDFVAQLCEWMQKKNPLKGPVVDI